MGGGPIPPRGKARPVKSSLAPVCRWGAQASLPLAAPIHPPVAAAIHGRLQSGSFSSRNPAVSGNCRGPGWGVKGTSRILGRGARPARPHTQQVLTALRTWFVNPRASMSNY